MPDHELLANEGVLMVRPERPLMAEGFTALAQEAEAMAWIAG